MRQRQGVDLAQFLRKNTQRVCRPFDVRRYDWNRWTSPDADRQEQDERQITPDTPRPVPFLFNRPDAAPRLSDADGRAMESPIARSRAAGQRFRPDALTTPVSVPSATSATPLASDTTTSTESPDFEIRVRELGPVLITNTGQMWQSQWQKDRTDFRFRDK